MMNPTIKKEILKSHNLEIKSVSDTIAVEEPLQITLSNGGVYKDVSITMRTPGHDDDLAIGFLFTEGIITPTMKIEHQLIAPNQILIKTITDQVLDLESLNRNFYTNSSCGVCGKSSIESIETISSFAGKQGEHLSISPSIISELPNTLRQHQQLFKETGGIHAAGIFNAQGDLIHLSEDVGRHNALDKLIGYGYKNGLLPYASYVLVLSGRTSFELIQKAHMAGVKFIIAVGAPSSLAVDLARKNDITLIGFVNKSGFNIYSADHRIAV